MQDLPHERPVDHEARVVVAAAKLREQDVDVEKRRHVGGVSFDVAVEAGVVVPGQILGEEGAPGVELVRQLGDDDFLVSFCALSATFI